MATLSFTLLPETLRQFHGVLACLAKFNETVTIEAELDRLRLSTLNSTKTGYASFKFSSTSFFSSYLFNPELVSGGADNTPGGSGDKLTCQLYLKALLSVFKGRTADFRDKDTAVERCDVQLYDSSHETECRLVIQMHCKHGILKTYRLTYEAVEAQHAVFDSTKTQNLWDIDSRFLREIADHFGPSAEQLDICSEDGRVVFTSFTEKIMSGTEVLKQPVHTSVAIDTRDFNDFAVEEELHVAINVKDFKAIIFHADSLKTKIIARYTRPRRPLQLSYAAEGMDCEFTLMTRGDADEPDAESRASRENTIRELSARASPRPRPRTQTATQNQAADSEEPRQVQPSRSQSALPDTIMQEARADTPESPPAPVEDDDLFVPADDDQQWDEAQYGDADEEDDVLRWDANIDQESMRQRLGGTIQDVGGAEANRKEESGQPEQTAIPPTQRISQVRGLFD